RNLARALQVLSGKPNDLWLGPGAEANNPEVLYTFGLASRENLIEQLRSGDARSLARAISTVENHAPGWIDLLKGLFPHTGKALTIGITGSPGAGKSTLVDQLAKQFRKESHTVGIIAVDPTSPYTGSAIL